MSSLFDTRRYLTHFDSTRTANILTDVLVIGSGVAGVRAAIEAAQHGLVILVTKAGFQDSSTTQAQGGIAAAMGPGDKPDLHREDTLRVGCGLNDADAVEFLVREAPARIEELAAWGMRFDRKDDALSLGREGGHSVHRIVHAQGDQTGRELTRTLKARLLLESSVRVFEHCFVIDLITVDETCVGAVTYHPRHGHQIIWAKQTILACGGCGQLWRETTNPVAITGDGLAAAFRAGARLRDMEFMQFHPTTLYVAGAARALISEAVRGEGAYLVDRTGHRFMLGHHPDGELAPRDIVSRVIHNHLVESRSPCVYLDVRHLPQCALRFPNLARLCSDFGLDLSRDLIPVRPSAHYLIGGVEVTLDGTTSVEGLLCCGEAASTGVHGANRMASNSLLEGLVFGRRAGQTAGRRVPATSHADPVRRLRSERPPSPRTDLDLPDVVGSLRSLMGRNVGIVRTGQRLTETVEILTFWGRYTLDKTFDDPVGWGVQNQLILARLVAASALERTESIGVHFRGDAPAPPRAAPADSVDPGSLYHVVTTRHPHGTSPVRVPHSASSGIRS